MFRNVAFLCNFTGKPVAVTHSRGKGAKDRPGAADLAYEKAQWQKKRLSIKKGPGKGKSRPPDELAAGQSLGPIDELNLGKNIFSSS